MMYAESLARHMAESEPKRSKNQSLTEPDKVNKQNKQMPEALSSQRSSE